MRTAAGTGAGLFLPTRQRGRQVRYRARTVSRWHGLPKHQLAYFVRARSVPLGKDAMHQSQPPVRSRILSAALAACLLAGCSPGGDTPAPSDAATPARAKNIVLFIGDGMSIATVTAARIYDGQSQGMSGEEHYLAFERFENVALVKTYNTNQQVPDSAGTCVSRMLRW